MRFYSRLVLILVVLSCSDPIRENIVDPVAAPQIEMSAPVVDGGAILIEWRYLAEAGDLAEFQITRVTEGGSVVLSTLQATPAAGWQNASFRDSVYIAGVSVLYELRARDLGGGDELAFASDRIQVDGTILSVTPDNENLRIRLEWEREPPGTVGYEIIRTGTEGDSKILLTINDPGLHTFDDQPSVGNVFYQYEILTFLDSGAVKSDVVSGRLFGLTSSVPKSTGPAAERYLLLASAGTFAFAASGEPYVLTDGSPRSIGPPQSAAGTLSAAGLINSDPGFIFSVAGKNREGTEVHVSAFPGFIAPEITHVDPTVTRRWPSAGGSRTGVIWAGDANGKLLVYEGNELRVLSDSLVIENTVQLEAGEPVDIAYQSGSIWLAYSNRLITSNNTFLQEGVTSWQEIPLPLGVTVTSLSALYGDRLLILDGSTGTLHAVDLQGKSLITLAAIGPDLEKGDVLFFHRPNGEPEIQQIDGEGTIHWFLWPAD